MSVTRDATKGWARPASAAEWTEMLSGTGLPNPSSSGNCTEGSGNLADDIGSVTLTAANTPIYGASATGWATTGVDGTDNSGDRFVAAAGVGPDPSTTSQFWLFVVALQTEPTADRVLGGINTGSGTTGVRLLFHPVAGTNKLRINSVNVNTDGAVDFAVGDYIIGVMYDRAGSRAKAYSDVENVTGTYAAGAVDGNKGIGGSAYPGGAVIMLWALWTGTDAEGLDDTDVATIISRIKSAPAAGGGVSGHMTLTGCGN